MFERRTQMPLPPTAFYSVFEIAARWGCYPSDVAGWAIAGHFPVLAGIAPVRCGDEVVAGLVEVPIAELMPMFRRFGTSEEICRLRRLRRPGEDEWRQVTEPPDGVPIHAADLMLAASSVQVFEEDRELMRRPASKVGSSARYEWDQMYAWLFWHAIQFGLPETQAGFVGLVQDWFIRHAKAGEVPDESTIRKKLNLLWRKVRGEETV
jgi:hypothetical protein